ncbi:DUF5684 domain-containing protein [Microbacterium testaceum]|uniref:DUF5684 domain-containing protein n=1 Tax=Microbacterium testaceum TaxID=2033 RepID=UPI001D174AF7|nr:DUF5684 domain-containing protein [Microbacterium testaceum]MCC4248637.1 DUF5684 domain-containing protein [Microbacterium testaceum]
MNDSTGVILGALTLLLFVIVYVWYALALAAVFSKTGEAAPWKAWVPILNAATVLKLGGFSPWLVLLVLIPIFGAIAFIVVMIVAVHRVTLGFDRGAGMTVLGALVPVVWASVLGFGGARWHGGDVPGIRRSGGVDEDSAPVRRGQDFAGPYVPLVGGWTPEPLRPAETTRADAADASAESGSEPVALPFAAPAPSLADAVPSPSDWAPPAPAAFVPPAPAGRDDAEDSSGPRGDRDTVDLRESLSDVLAALRAPAATRAEASAAPAVASETGGAGASAAAPAAAAEDAPVLEPWRGPTRRTPAVEEPNADEPLTRPASTPDTSDRGPGDEFPELSDAVSAVPEAPKAGAPRSARTSVSALYTQPEFPAEPGGDDDFDALDRTVVTRRRRIPWALVPPNGAPIDLTSDVVILGRRPAEDASHPDAQLVVIADETRTVSKTHARLQLKGETWYVTDLDSTNGVLFATLMGTEVEAPPGEEIEAGERFFLGDAEVRLTRRQP